MLVELQIKIGGHQSLFVVPLALLVVIEPCITGHFPSVSLDIYLTPKIKINNQKFNQNFNTNESPIRMYKIKLYAKKI